MGGTGGGVPGLPGLGGGDRGRVRERGYAVEIGVGLRLLSCRDGLSGSDEVGESGEVLLARLAPKSSPSSHRLKSRGGGTWARGACRFRWGRVGETEMAGLPRGDGGLVWNEEEELAFMRGRDCW